MASEKKSVSKKNAKSSKKKAKSKVVNYVPRLRKQYLENVTSKLIARFNYTNPMEVPKLSTISINMGVGDAKVNPKALDRNLYSLINSPVSVSQCCNVYQAPPILISLCSFITVNQLP